MHRTPRAALACASLGLAILASATGACNYEDTAKETFSHDNSCPESRVTVKKRPDVDAYAATFGEGAPPPADVAKDRERLAMWKKEQREQRDRWNSSFTVFEVKGCGADELYFCGQAGTSGGKGTHSSCSKIGSASEKDPKRRKAK